MRKKRKRSSAEHKWQEYCESNDAITIVQSLMHRGCLHGKRCEFKVEGNVVYYRYLEPVRDLGEVHTRTSKVYMGGRVMRKQLGLT